MHQDAEIDKRVAPAVAAGIFGVAGGTALNAGLTGVVKGTTSGTVKKFANKILGNPHSKRQVDPVIPTEEVWSFEDLEAVFAKATVEELFTNAKEEEAAVCVSVEYEVEHDEKTREVESVDLGNGEEKAVYVQWSQRSCGRNELTCWVASIAFCLLDQALLKSWGRRATPL